MTPLRRQVAATVATDVLPASMPMTIFTGDGFHFRVRDGRVLLLWPTPGVAGAPFEMPVDPGMGGGGDSQGARDACRRSPRVPVDRAASWAGLYEMSPDKHAILGAAPDCPNLYLINGSSGHGVMHAPALGHLLAEIILDGRASTTRRDAAQAVAFCRRALEPCVRAAVELPWRTPRAPALSNNFAPCQRATSIASSNAA